MGFESGFFSIIIILTFCQGLFLTVICTKSSSPNRQAKLFLVYLLLCASLINLDAFLYVTGLYRYVPFLIFSALTILPLYGPLYYLYSKALIHKNFRLKWKDLLLFIPFIVVYFFMFPLIAADSANKAAILNAMFLLPIMPKYQILTVWHIISLLFFLLPAALAIRGHRKKRGNTFSPAEKNTLSWLYFISALYFLHIISYSLSVIYAMISGIHYGRATQITSLAGTVFIYALGYRSLKQPGILYPLPGPSREEKKKRRTISISDDEAKRCFERLEDLMTRKRLFLNPELTLHLLAEELSLSSYYLSYIINRFADKNFYDYINRYRIEEVKKSLADRENLNKTILSLAYDAGFNSKATFNKVFKNTLKVSPREYRKNKLNDSK